MRSLSVHVSLPLTLPDHTTRTELWNTDYNMDSLPTNV
ncbi:hypothetical protein C7450_113127 [Chelatococcus asaccharovorans]|uniref:Uncharacterized protein n=1 Tax=Chelatococcus asaccharovorans TaxID=28210 RepID=A0A2V3TVT5_9HYPH|nr:hypothetical protein C7450_113127 [Chelatococcus asaccharovorans]